MEIWVHLFLSLILFWVSAVHSKKSDLLRSKKLAATTEAEKGTNAQQTFLDVVNYVEAKPKSAKLKKLRFTKGSSRKNKKYKKSGLTKNKKIKTKTSQPEKFDYEKDSAMLIGDGATDSLLQFGSTLDRTQSINEARRSHMSNKAAGSYLPWSPKVGWLVLKPSENRGVIHGAYGNNSSPVPMKLINLEEAMSGNKIEQKRIGDETNEQYVGVSSRKAKENITHVLKNYKKSCNETELRYNKTIAGIPLAFKYPVIYENQELLKHRIKNIMLESNKYNAAEDVPEPHSGFLFLRKSVSIVSEFCGVADSKMESFLHQAFNLFVNLRKLTAVSKDPYLTKNEDEQILKSLVDCHRQTTKIKFFTEECDELIIASGSRSNYICPLGKKFAFDDEYDPILDIMWHVYSLVHATCFEYFENDNMRWHKYSLAILDLYNGSMKRRWSTVPGKADLFVRLLGPNFRVHLKNLHRCMQAYVKNSKIPYFSPRYAEQENVHYSLHGVNSDLNTPITSSNPDINYHGSEPSRIPTGWN